MTTTKTGSKLTIQEPVRLASGGSSTFVGLLDTPNEYVGQRGKFVAVSPQEDGLIFTQGSTSFDLLSDTPSQKLMADGQMVVVSGNRLVYESFGRQSNLQTVSKTIVPAINEINEISIQNQKSLNDIILGNTGVVSFGFTLYTSTKQALPDTRFTISKQPAQDVDVSISAGTTEQIKVLYEGIFINNEIKLIFTDPFFTFAFSYKTQNFVLDMTLTIDVYKENADGTKITLVSLPFVITREVQDYIKEVVSSTLLSTFTLEVGDKLGLKITLVKDSQDTTSTLDLLFKAGANAPIFTINIDNIKLFRLLNIANDLTERANEIKGFADFVSLAKVCDQNIPYVLQTFTGSYLLGLNGVQQFQESDENLIQKIPLDDLTFRNISSSDYQALADFPFNFRIPNYSNLAELFASKISSGATLMYSVAPSQNTIQTFSTTSFGIKFEFVEQTSGMTLWQMETTQSCGFNEILPLMILNAEEGSFVSSFLNIEGVYQTTLRISLRVLSGNSIDFTIHPKYYFGFYFNFAMSGLKNRFTIQQDTWFWLIQGEAISSHQGGANVDFLINGSGGYAGGNMSMLFSVYDATWTTTEQNRLTTFGATRTGAVFPFLQFAIANGGNLYGRCTSGGNNVYELNVKSVKTWKNPLQANQTERVLKFPCSPVLESQVPSARFTVDPNKVQVNGLN